MVTAVIINYKTPELTLAAVESLRLYYHGLKIIVIDNGSKMNYLERLKFETTLIFSGVELISNTKNIHHGPAMHQAINYITTDYALFFDSDCKVIKKGFLEKMIKLIKTDKLNYAVGKLIFLNKRGFPTDDPQKGFAYIKPFAMLLKCDIYKKLPPFKKHGSPCLENMIAAVNNGFKLINFDVEEYILHLGRGTASKYGYNLGIRGKINYILNKLKL